MGRKRTTQPAQEDHFPLDVKKLAETEKELLARGSLPPVMHRFDATSLHAINAALAAERPLLLRGEPGTGKSQLARAAADLLKRRFRLKVVDAHTEVADLFYSFDALARLAYAQIIGALGASRDPTERAQVLAELHERHFVRPGPLWWAFDEAKARDQDATYRSRCGAEVTPDPDADEDDQRRGWVVLIDEIDKADPSVPNGLLEALGQGTFDIPGGRTISLHGQANPPLVVITTNEERELPSAFVRRCMVLKIELPDDDGELRTWLMRRGRTNFTAAKEPKEAASEKVLEEAAKMVIEDRKAAQRLGLTAPGQAEYLDLVRAVMKLGKSETERVRILQDIRVFALKKHPDQPAAARER